MRVYCIYQPRVEECRNGSRRCAIQKLDSSDASGAKYNTLVMF